MHFTLHPGSTCHLELLLTFSYFILHYLCFLPLKWWCKDINLILCTLTFQAAALLKKTEGVVTLVLCNPNKAKEEVDQKARVPTPTPPGSVEVKREEVKETEKPSEYLSFIGSCFRFFYNSGFSLCSYKSKQHASI